MKAIAQLEVKRDMRMHITLELSVDEADALLEATETVSKWPTHNLREVLRQALSKARGAYHSEHVIEP